MSPKPQVASPSKPAPWTLGKIARLLALIAGGMLLLLAALIAASYLFDFSVPWPDLLVGWVMIVVPTSMLILGTLATRTRSN